MTEDGNLLRQYAQTGSEQAFSELVRRHLPLVYSAALRQAHGNSAMAKDVAQSVFIDLAKKALSLADHGLLVGWLYTSTRLAASKAIRSEHRRQLRERIAASMQANDGHQPREQLDLLAVVDEAMGKLAARDRNVLLLRFFQAKDLKAVGTAMGVSEDAARMRVTRALGKLHSLVTKRGAALSVAGLGTLLAAEAVTATPAGLAASISAVAVTSAGASGGTVALLKALSLAKLKAGVISAILVVGIAAPLIIRQQSRVRHQTQNPSTRLSNQGTVASVSARIETSGDAASLSENNQSAKSWATEQELRRAKLRAQGVRLREQTATFPNNSASQRAVALSKVALLKAWLNEMPEKGIPEIRLCKDADWFNVVRWAALEDETGARKALLGIRNLAKRRFDEDVVSAINKYTATHQQHLPAELGDLIPFLDPITAKTLIDRYELSPEAKEPNVSAADWVINEKLSVDADYDTHHQIGVYGIAVQPTSQDSGIAKNTKL